MDNFFQFITKKVKIGNKEKLELEKCYQEYSLEKFSNMLKKTISITEQELLEIMADYFCLDLFTKENLNLESNFEQLSLEEVEKNKLIILKQTDQFLTLGSLYPIEPLIIEKYRYKFNREIKNVLMSQKDFKQIKAIVYHNYFNVDSKDILKDYSFLDKYNQRDLNSLKKLVKDAPVVKLLDKILQEAISLTVSDIHLEKKADYFKVRYRIDGILKTYYKLPIVIADAVISRVKIMSGLDITNRHLPQDGKLDFEFQTVNYDIRTSTIPTIYGEKAVLRLLKRGQQMLDLNKLKFSSHNLQRLKKIINHNSGIILLSGPTGSGKTTTLFSILNKLASQTNNIITIENPVEYKLDLLNQIEVNPAQGLNFVTALRSILRQDPDIIMIGEIRDKETAKIAVRAAVTGHLVFSTIHTNDSASAVARLLEMEIPAYLISSSLKGVVAQRLLRRLCPYCKKELRLSLEDQELLKIDQSNQKSNKYKFYQAVGCQKCAQTGYHGRVAIGEVLLVSDKIKELINQKSDSNQIKQAALKQGMQSLYRAAINKVKIGESSIAELKRIVDYSS